MKTIARLRYFGVPPLKVRRYARTIKDEPVDRALAILELQPSPTCQVLSKLLMSAIANAQQNNDLAPENLLVSNVLVDHGPSLKRIKPRARGRAFRVLKRSCHVTIEVDLKPGVVLESEKEEKVEKKAKRTVRKKAEGKQEKSKTTRTSRARKSSTAKTDENEAVKAKKDAKEKKAKPKSVSSGKTRKATQDTPRKPRKKSGGKSKDKGKE